MSRCVQTFDWYYRWRDRWREEGGQLGPIRRDQLLCPISSSAKTLLLISINSNDKCVQVWQRLINSRRGEKITGVRLQIFHCQRHEQVLSVELAIPLMEYFHYTF